jgi:hypothetical protein
MHRRHEGLESREDLCGSLARREIVVARVEDNYRRLVWDNDALRKLRDVACLRSSKAAIQNRHSGKVAIERRPHSDGRAADEDNAPRAGRAGPILGFELSDVGLPLTRSTDGWRNGNRALTNDLRRASQQAEEDE